MSKKKKLFGKVVDVKKVPTSVLESKVFSAIDPNAIVEPETKILSTGKINLLDKAATTLSKSTGLIAAKRSKSKQNSIISTIPADNENYFVYLNNPLEYRRHILESSRKVLFCLRTYQNILLIRQKKAEEIKILKINLKELAYTIRKFKEKLPKYNATFLESVAKNQKTVVEKHPVSPVINATPQAKTELEKLEESLANIERKLKNLQ